MVTLNYSIVPGSIDPQNVCDRVFLWLNLNH